MKKKIQTVNIHEARTQLSKLIGKASKGEPFIIAKSAKPLVKVIPVDAPGPRKIQRLGFMSGQMSIPDDFDTGIALRSSSFLKVRSKTPPCYAFASLGRGKNPTG